ncbi:uncharacterized protein [Leptinotarsa decemlineata]|uniref:uncharacterized protein n=1 Tax=Leptinotarsa decemlineata TaxID=7539 RepID=UPI003D305C89
MLLFRNLAVLTAFVAVTFAQDYYDDEPRASRPAPPRVQPGYSGPAAPRPTPVPILKQINRHNEDGSYTYGYEAADGTFKIETKLPTGEVKGKYGYVDDVGKVRVVEYGATKYGFEPSGEGITVPPPTLVDESAKNAVQDQDYYEPQAPARRAPAPRPRPQPQQDFQSYSPPQQFEPAPAPPRAQVPGAAPAPASVQHSSFDFGIPSRPAPERSFAPAPRPRPAPVQFAQPAPANDDYEAPRAPPPRINYAQPALPRPSPQFAPAPERFAPAPRPAQSFAPRPSPSVPSGGRGGILDQLSKDYALPSGGSTPLHDISFGYY